MNIIAIYLCPICIRASFATFVEYVEINVQYFYNVQSSKYESWKKMPLYTYPEIESFHVSTTRVYYHNVIFFQTDIY